jgi:hypothetical protein
MKKIIAKYSNRPGEHCGSAAMRNLLAFHAGLDLPESVVFGLGAGLDFFLLEPPGGTPMLSGRSVSLESDAASHLGIPYTENFEPNDEKAWSDARQEVLEGRPVMLTGDIYYLDYREFKVHFPAHRFVLVGFDDAKKEAYIMDRIKEVAEACSYDALSVSRNPPKGISTFNLWGKFLSGKHNTDLEAACHRSIQICAERMLGESQNPSLLMQGLRMQFQLKSGLEALRSLPATIASWQDRPDASGIAGFNADCIEKFGTGGAMFRNLYVDFLAWCRLEYPSLVSDSSVGRARESAAMWTALAQAFYKLHAHPAEKHPWREAIHQAKLIAQKEEDLFTGLWRGLRPD